MPLANSLLGGGAVGAQNAYELHFTTVSVRANANVAGFYGDWNGRCDGWNGQVTARVEADGLVVVFSRRTLGLPSFVIGGILFPVVLALVRLIQGLDLGNRVIATITLVVGGLLVWLISTVILRGAAMASRRIRLATRGPFTTLWTVIGGCGNPPKDQSRKFAIIAILLTTVAWVIVPAAIATAVLT